MPRQRIHHTRETYEVPNDFRERLARFKEGPGLSSAEIARRVGAHPYTVRRWGLGRARPDVRYMMALVDLAEELDLRHIFTG